MKTWTLVWFLVFPPEGPNQDVTWEAAKLTNLTRTECFEQLADKDQEYRDLINSGDAVGHEVYCRNEKADD